MSPYNKRRTASSRAPSRKWVATQITAVSAWLVAAITAGWDISQDLQIVGVGVVTQAVVGYLLPNAGD